MSIDAITQEMLDAVEAQRAQRLKEFRALLSRKVNLDIEYKEWHKKWYPNPPWTLSIKNGIRYTNAKM